MILEYPESDRQWNTIIHKTLVGGSCPKKNVPLTR